MNKKYFPIKTETACQQKWSWSTLYLNTGITRSCHRTGESILTAENFFEFHNTPLKIRDREAMLRGEWPVESCGYCKDVEEQGGISDRIRMTRVPNLSPVELENNPTATSVSPTLIEVYFNNSCNLGCLYCDDTLSSTIEAENKKFGMFEKGGVKLVPKSGHFKDLVPYFWQWLETGFSKIKRLHVLGGEPLFQKDFYKLLDYIEQHPNPECEFNVITNLMVSPDLLKKTIQRFKTMLIKRQLKRIDITCSIDCWGAPQEYVRWGINLTHWEENFKYLLDQKWLILNINQTIMPLTIKTMPELLEKLAGWRKHRTVGHYFSGVLFVPDYLKCDVFGEEIFRDDINKILSCMPRNTDEDILAYDYMSGYLNLLCETNMDVARVKDIIIFLNENDRRRGSDWRVVFPWLNEIEKNVV